MEIGQASEVVTYLSQAFPTEWQASDTQAWVEFLEPLDYPSARSAASELMSSTSVPDMDSFMVIYRRLLPRRIVNEDEYRNDPHTPKEWERQAQAHREWRRSNYPEVDDPSEGTPLPRSRLDFNREWGVWFKLKFGWTPEQVTEEAKT